jgi:hypothetical protein
MNKYSPTPRPWVCHSGSVWRDGPDVYPKGQNNGIPICRMDREPGNGTIPVERDANCALIVKAVNNFDDMRALLVRAAIRLQEYSTDTDDFLNDPLANEIEVFIKQRKLGE